MVMKKIDKNSSPLGSVTKTVNVAKLKNDLSKYLRLAKKGQEIIVTEHKMPIARVVPFENADGDLQVIPAQYDLTALQEYSLKTPVKRGWNSLDLLLEDRKKR